METLQLRIGAITPQSSVNGPFQRFVVWCQGCSIRCPGCVNPQLQPTDCGVLMTVDAMAKRIMMEPGIEGVTYTGGEPFLQAAALTALSKRIRSRGLGVVCYTGYTLEQLQSPDAPEGSAGLLEQVDLLIDGPFLIDQMQNLPWRGSANQRLIALTPRYRDALEQAAAQTPTAEMALTHGALTLTGFWPEGFSERLTRTLADGPDDRFREAPDSPLRG